MSQKQPNIAILGGGPGGLTLARLLQRNGVKCTVFERDFSPQARSQGGTLDLHSESGQLALKEAGLWEKCVSQKLVRYEADVFKLMDKTGKVYMDENEAQEDDTRDSPPEAHDRPEMDRTVLRKLLLDSLDDGVVLWNRNISDVVRNKQNHDLYDIVFTNAPKATGFNLVIGADGAWSHTRSLVTDASPFYCGIVGVEMRFTDVATRHPEVARLVGEGMLMVPSDNKLLTAQRLGDGSLQLYAAMRVPQTWPRTCGINFTDAAATREGLISRYFKDWIPDFHKLFRACDTDGGTIARSLYMLPVGTRWKSHHNVTLLGDAAHLMTPYAGEGVNLAMLDALTLARELVKSKGNWGSGDLSGLGPAIKEYEEAMFAYSSEKAQETRQNLDLLFTDGPPTEFFSLMESLMNGPSPEN